MHPSSDSGSARQAPQEPATRPKVISMRDVPSTLYTRPQRHGPTDRFEPGDALIRTYIESDRFHVGVWDALPGESFWTDKHPVDEFLYVIEGVATILVPPLREAIEAHQGDVVHMPAGTEHQTMNRGRH